MNDERELFPRACGVLLHPTSLPGAGGVGALGCEARRFVDWLAAAGQSVWQVLPLGPTSYGDSPYQTLSAFAGNHLLIDLQRLVEQGWLWPDDLAACPDLPADRVDFGRVIEYRSAMLDRATTRFAAEAEPAENARFVAWCDTHADWLDDYALFVTLKEIHGGACWVDWPRALAGRDADALAAAARENAERIEAHKLRQWFFHTQWLDLRRYAAERGIRIFGDLPIFVAHDSCDVWARPECFLLDERGYPTVVAGVPPDYFSETGQLWGNPLYNWRAIADDRYRWWRDRLRATLELVDIVRIDHFRGFASCWEVPVDAKTAVNGRWVPGPAEEFFAVMGEYFGKLPIIAEDLGVITRRVESLRDDFDLPGMKVLQFAWSGPDNLFQPHNHVANCVVYSGTHDNDPTLGWWVHDTSDEQKRAVADYIGAPVIEPNWTMIRLGMGSVAHTFIATMQDVLGLGRESRMNLPGEGTGNWDWRMPAEALDDPARERLAHLTWLYRRRADQVLAPADEEIDS